MAKNDLNPFDRLVLDSDEKAIEDFIDPNNVKEVVGHNKTVNNFVQSAKKYRKDRHISIRIGSQDLEIIRNKAQENGIPYQTLVSTLLHQYASGKIKINL